MQSEKFSESEFMSINEDSGHDKKDADVPEKVSEQKIHTKGTLKMFCAIESVKDKIREADPKLERNATTSQSAKAQKRCSLCTVSYVRRWY